MYGGGRGSLRRPLSREMRPSDSPNEDYSFLVVLYHKSQPSCHPSNDTQQQQLLFFCRREFRSQTKLRHYYYFFHVLALLPYACNAAGRQADEAQKTDQESEEIQKNRYVHEIGFSDISVHSLFVMKSITNPTMDE